jgi:hypothetical protein
MSGARSSPLFPSIQNTLATGVPRTAICCSISSFHREDRSLHWDSSAAHFFFWSKSGISSTKNCSRNPLGIRALYASPMPKVRVEADPEDVDVPRSRLKVTKPGGSRERLAEAAYDFVRSRMLTDIPTIPARSDDYGSPHHQPWAIQRAFDRLVTEGVLSGPVLMPKRKDGKMVWYHYSTGPGELYSMNGIVWAEGAWRMTHFQMTDRMIKERANWPRKMARAKNKRVQRDYDFQTARHRADGMWKGIHPARTRPVEARVPSMSQIARVREYFRSIAPVDWDGMAYLPVPGPALDAVIAWKASLPRPPRPTRERPVREVRTCRRCGGAFPRSHWIKRRAHSIDECNVLIVTRVMTE